MYMPLCSNTTNDPVLATIFVFRTGTGGWLELPLPRLRIALSPAGAISSHKKEAVASLASDPIEQLPKTLIMSSSRSLATATPQPSSGTSSKTSSVVRTLSQVKK